MIVHETRDLDRSPVALIDDYLWSCKFQDIDNDALIKQLYIVNDWIAEQCKEDPEGRYGNSLASYWHGNYNLLSFPTLELNKLYYYIAETAQQVCRPGAQYYIRCWFNLFENGQNIKWHRHWNTEDEAYHGFYCVRTEGEHPSWTDYRIPDQEEEHRIMSSDGTLVLGKSEDDRHMSSVWQNDGHRITIAYDIVPMHKLNFAKPQDLFPLFNK
jgi:hypothetical protein